MRASIAITAHNEGELLLKTVESCLRSIENLDCEIVVADDASTDGSIERLKQDFPEVRVHSSAERRGCPATKDLAARASQGDVLIFLDAHCKPRGDAIRTLIEDVELWHGDAIISPNIVHLDTARWQCMPPTSDVGYWVDVEWFHSGWVKSNELSRAIAPGGRRFLEQPSIAGCCVAVSRTLYDKLWGFDRYMLSWGMEDLDFGLKGWLMGHALLVDPEAVIGHRFAQGAPEYPVPLEHLLVNRLRTARKNFEENAWKDWCWRHRAYYPARRWLRAWRLFESTRQSVEDEREYLQRTRPHDIYQYALEFGLAWPLTLRSSPYHLPPLFSRPRYTCPYERSMVLRTTHKRRDVDEGDEPDTPGPPHRPFGGPRRRPRKRPL